MENHKKKNCATQSQHKPRMRKHLIFRKALCNIFFVGTFLVLIPLLRGHSR